MSEYLSTPHTSRNLAARFIVSEPLILYFLFNERKSGDSFPHPPNKFFSESDEATMGKPDLSNSSNVSICL